VPNDPGEAQRPGAPPRLQQWHSETYHHQNGNGGALLPPAFGSVSLL
jgi:hypothetical protein